MVMVKGMVIVLGRAAGMVKGAANEQDKTKQNFCSVLGKRKGNGFRRSPFWYPKNQSLFQLCHTFCTSSLSSSMSMSFSMFFTSPSSESVM